MFHTYDPQARLYLDLGLGYVKYQPVYRVL